MKKHFILLVCLSALCSACAIDAGSRLSGSDPQWLEKFKQSRGP